ncbi:protein kinase-like domain-containing protein [Xylariomycetidae sp. FL2044]|nr:protein kinase-like domain-containing protein [Xylariomycetidae sp. FL2044]
MGPREMGYHPITIGQHLNGRYRVVHKLGYGAYSTTWLARDEQTAKYIAVKVGTADSSRAEFDVLTQITESNRRCSPHAGKLILPVLDRFDISGPNGIHPCLLALAVAHIHDLGYVHGDLHLGNVLLRLPSNIDHLSDEQLYDEFGPPDSELVSRADEKPLSSGVPSHVFAPIWLGVASEELPPSEARILLTDFGTAFRPSQIRRFESYTPLDIRPPEARFEPTTPLSFGSDIWSLACTMWAILGQRSLLDSFLFGQDDATADQIDFLGPLPPEWWERWGEEARSKRFSGNSRLREGRSPWTMEGRLEDSIREPRREKGMDTVGDEEGEDLLAMIRWMLAFRPGERPSAEQVLETAWMRKWTIPNISQRYCD